MLETWEIKGYTVEFIEDEETETHTYLVNGVVLPSITQILKIKFGGKYNTVSQEVLKRASKLGTATHKAIEEYCKNGVESDCKELRNFKFLQKQFKFTVIDNEIPIILFKDNEPVACGRLDLVLNDEEERMMLGDIKRTSVLDKEYLAYQLNLYRLGYQQCYDTEIEALKGIHLREDVRKYVDIPINEDLAMELLNKYLDERGNEND